MFKRIFQNRTFWFYLAFVPMALAIATIVAVAVKPGFAYGNFDSLTVIFLAVGIALQVVSVFWDQDFVPVLATAMYGCGLGRIIENGGSVIADKMNNISFVGGDFNMVALYIGLMLLCCVIMVICCFASQRKKPAGQAQNSQN